jgi:hypothetical protein
MTSFFVYCTLQLSLQVSAVTTRAMKDAAAAIEGQIQQLISELEAAGSRAWTLTQALQAVQAADQATADHLERAAAERAAAELAAAQQAAATRAAAERAAAAAAAAAATAAAKPAEDAEEAAAAAPGLMAAMVGLPQRLLSLLPTRRAP